MGDAGTETTTKNPIETRKMLPEESISSEKDIFQQLVSSAEVSKETLLESWNNYRRFTLKRQEVGIYDFSPETAKAIHHAAEVRWGILNGKSITIPNKTLEAAFDAYFLGDTVGTMFTGGKPGVLLEGLEGDELKSAVDFCKAMNKVGLKPGDIEVVQAEK